MALSRRGLFGMSAAALAIPVMGHSRASASTATPASGETAFTIYPLTIRGTVATATIEEARNLHNQTAGDPASIAAARALGDISHLVYVPLTPAEADAGEILFMDLWISLEGLNEFFANPQVQDQAAQLFSERDPVVWEPASGFVDYHFLAPQGQDARVVALTRGMVASRDEALSVHNSLVVGQIGNARSAGNLSHDPYFRLAAPGESETLELLAVDIWMDPSSMLQFYSDPDIQRSFSTLFVSPPDISIWTTPTATWTEW